MKGDGARVVAARVVGFVVAPRLCVDVDAAGLRTPTLALLLTFALGLAPGVGEDDFGSVLSGEGGRERSYSNRGVT